MFRLAVCSPNGSHELAAQFGNGRLPLLLKKTPSATRGGVLRTAHLRVSEFSPSAILNFALPIFSSDITRHRLGQFFVAESCWIFARLVPDSRWLFA